MTMDLLGPSLADLF